MVLKFFFKIYKRASLQALWLNRRFTPAGMMALGAWGLSANMGLAPGSTLMYQVFAVLCIMFGISWLFSLGFRGDFEVERILPRWVSAGTPACYRVRIKNKSSRKLKGLTLLEHNSHLLPDWQSFFELSRHKNRLRGFFQQSVGLESWFLLARLNRKVVVEETPVPALLPGETREVMVKMQPLHRGYYRFSGICVARRDPFGLWRALKGFRSEQTLLVLPRMFRLPPVSLPGKRHYQPMGVTLASSVGESEEFVGLRDYAPGDPLRDIHWRSWAKYGEPVVRQYQEEFFSRQALILDTFSGEEGSAQFEEAVSIAASFVNNIDLQDSLLDLMFIGTEAYCFTSGRSLGSVERMLEILASVNVCRGQPFSALTRQVLERSGLLSGCLCVFLSWDEKRQELVTHLRALDLPVRVMVVLEQDADSNLDPGPMRDMPEEFQVLKTGAIEEGLEKS